MFDQITEEFKMSRVIDTATITALMDQVIADIESDGGILCTFFSFLYTDLQI